MNYYSDQPEWQFLFRNAIDWETVLSLYPDSASFGANTSEKIAFFEEILTSTGKWTAEVLGPRARELDTIGGGKLVDGGVEISEPLRKTYEEAKGLEIFGLGVDPKNGGMGVPSPVLLIGFAQICRSDVATGTQIGFYTTISDMIERFCDKETVEKFVPMIRRGEISGSMCLTEPDAGSDVGALRTSAEKTADGTYLINGTKCFITNGGGGLGFVLARIKGAPKGLEGISLFFVEEKLNGKRNYKITKIEDKMGMHGSPTCEVVYENTVGKLVGNEGDGFKIMLHLMNEARISVGLQGLAGMEAAIDQVRAYAENRKQFGKSLMELPLYKRNVQDWETERDAMRALLVDTLTHFEVFQRLDMKKRHTGELGEAEAALLKKATRITRRRTPLVKYYGAEANGTITQKAIQAFGGYGYMREYEVERIHRDCFGALLYEGTSQIQALMAMKDFVKDMMKDPAKFIQSIVAAHPIGTLMSDSPFERSVKGVIYEFRKNITGLMMGCLTPDLAVGEKGFMQSITQIKSVFKKEYWQEADRFDKVMPHAETLCQAMSYIETLKVLGRQADQFPERGDLFHRYHKLVTPRFAAIYADWEQW